MEDYLKKFRARRPRPRRKDALLKQAAVILKRQEEREVLNLQWFHRYKLPLASAAVLLLVVCTNLMLEHRIKAQHSSLTGATGQVVFTVYLDRQQITPTLQGQDANAFAYLGERWRQAVVRISRRRVSSHPPEYWNMLRRPFDKEEFSNG